MGRAVKISGTGSYLPEKVMTNYDLEKIVDTTHEWIHTRSGISERHIAADDEATSHMAAAASRNALEAAGLKAEDLDMIIVGTITPDMVFPNTACFVQDQIGAKNAFCFDIEAACSGFLYSLDVAKNYIANGAAEHVLVIGAEKLSSITDWEDRATCVLFGDGAGAVILGAADEGTRGIMANVMGSDGSLYELLNVPGGGSRFPASHQTVDDRLHYMKMTGREVFKHAVRCMSDAAVKALDKAGLTVADVKCIIPHQANARIINAIASRLKTEEGVVYMNLERVGNMSAASVPVALDEAVREGRIKRGDIVLFVVFGGGFTWGASVLEW
ncbi:MAG: beta-ketoacyl-ACP synthase III [Kiritimatiellia bacterium]|jgi:3-oxoacyl-[acyl-carrier-protein] synthase-3|nr:beta-ketoacyl-ACP synthase III [Kiritimatiellia bacterium]MDP6810546.1 beta-ketoacyl-ACP synthase III [Kiritimatiellia bacterium]MDP7024938.1 beta-ketoacyl-ACP synthase III [Kiritimatiellia bacterium]